MDESTHSTSCPQRGAKKRMRLHSLKVHSELLVVLSEMVVVLSELLVVLQGSNLSVLGPDEIGLELVPHCLLADQLRLHINHPSSDIRQVRLNLGQSRFGISCLSLRLNDSQIG